MTQGKGDKSYNVNNASKPRREEARWKHVLYTLIKVSAFRRLRIHAQSRFRRLVACLCLSEQSCPITVENLSTVVFVYLVMLYVAASAGYVLLDKPSTICIYLENPLRSGGDCVKGT